MIGDDVGELVGDDVGSVVGDEEGAGDNEGASDTVFDGDGLLSTSEAVTFVSTKGSLSESVTLGAIVLAPGSTSCVGVKVELSTTTIVGDKVVLLRPGDTVGLAVGISVVLPSTGTEV